MKELGPSSMNDAQAGPKAHPRPIESRTHATCLVCGQSEFWRGSVEVFCNEHKIKLHSACFDKVKYRKKMNAPRDIISANFGCFRPGCGGSITKIVSCSQEDGLGANTVVYAGALRG